jgi:hypothetical protein
MSPDGSVVRSANISSDPETGIGRWTATQFVARFKNFADSSYTPPSVAVGEFNTVMPWTMYGGMKEEDLLSVFTFLQTVKPIANKVTIFSPAPPQ